jgi:hypothetical protein
VSLQLEAPAQVHVLLWRKLFIEALQPVEYLPGDGRVGAQAEREESQLPCGRVNQEGIRGSSSAPMSNTPATRLASAWGARMEATQPGAPRPRHHRRPTGRRGLTGPMFRAARRSSTGRSAHEVDAGVALRPPLHIRTGAILRAGAGHHDVPLARRPLRRRGTGLMFDPRHSVPDRYHHPDHGRFARSPLVRHTDLIDDRC